MHRETFTNDVLSAAIRLAAIGVGLVGVGHFLLSLVVWGLFYVAACRQEWNDVLTVPYAIRHLTLPVFLLAFFAWTSIAAWRRHQFVVAHVLVALSLSATAFAVEVRDDPQLQRVWFEEGKVCSCRQNMYCTWWWWQPRIR